LKKYLSDFVVLFLIAGLVVLLDQVTKYIIRVNLPMGRVFHPEWVLSNYARIVHWMNTGAAFGIFQNMSIVFTLLSFVVIGVILYYFPQVSRSDWAVRLAMGLLLGGALGNLIDRLRQGYVTDFLSVGNFPVFNVADASISCGVTVLFIGMLWQEWHKQPPQESPNPSERETTQETLPEPLSEEAKGE
jgi:signal peptidase II